MTTVLLTACSDNGSPEPFRATLVAPTVDNNQDTASRLAYSGNGGRFQRNDSCPNVPEGYSPLANVPVDFLDASGNVISSGSVTTNACGDLAAILPVGTVQIRAASANNKTLIAGIESIVASDGVASTVPLNADYRVGFLSKLDDNSLGFTVTDTISNKAVIGLSISSFAVSLDTTATSFTSIQNKLTTPDASIALVTDASGSMDDDAFFDTTTSTLYSRLNLSAIAAHQFLDSKEDNHEVGMVVFDSNTDFMNQNTIDSMFDLVDDNGIVTNYTFTESGFSRESGKLRFLVDAYNHDTKVWSDTNRFDTHPDTPAISVQSRYPWGGSTAFYDGTILASEKLDSRSNPRKIIITMSDGGDNSSSNNLSEVINTANRNGTPVYTIGFNFSDETDLQKLASDTGATYFKAENLEISDAYASILTNIIFQYTGTLAESINTASTVTLAFDIDGDGVPEASRVLVN